jgi:hypothetical protein
VRLFATASIFDSRLRDRLNIRRYEDADETRTGSSSLRERNRNGRRDDLRPPLRRIRNAVILYFSFGLRLFALGLKPMVD